MTHDLSAELQPRRPVDMDFAVQWVTEGLAQTYPADAIAYLAQAALSQGDPGRSPFEHYWNEFGFAVLDAQQHDEAVYPERAVQSLAGIAQEFMTFAVATDFLNGDELTPEDRLKRVVDMLKTEVSHDNLFSRTPINAALRQGFSETSMGNVAARLFSAAQSMVFAESAQEPLPPGWLSTVTWNAVDGAAKALYLLDDYTNRLAAEGRTLYTDMQRYDIPPRNSLDGQV